MNCLTISSDGIMSKSERIRELARGGMSVSDIAKKVEVSYQHAYNVCRASGLKSATRTGDASKPQHQPLAKPPLPVAVMLDGGFQLCGPWDGQEGRLRCPSGLPAEPGVYAFVIDGVAQYVGVATRSLAKRLYGYSRPGPSQKTNQRVSALLLELIAAAKCVEVYFAIPPRFEWNGLPVSGAEGLEGGLIQTFHLPWNVKGI